MDRRFIEDYKSFLNNAKTEREAARFVVKAAEEAGYKDINECKTLNAGDKVYSLKMGKAVALYNIGSAPLDKGMNILGAHIDSPRLDVKQTPLYEKDSIAYLNTHYYGGIKKYQWLALPLAIHGVVCRTDGTAVDVVIGEDKDDPVLCISDILPHLAQEQMKEKASDFVPGENLDVIVGSTTPPKRGDKDKEKDKKEGDKARKAVMALLKEKYNIDEADFGSAELEVVPAGLARDCGIDRSLILGYGQDDRSCAFASLRAMLKSTAGERTNCLLCVDKEEIGSVGATGMDSRFFENATAEVLSRMAEGWSGLALRRAMANSWMLSSDVNAAFDPLNPNLYDKDNASQLGAGIVFNKYTGSRGKSGASDARPEFIARVRAVLDRDGVPYQMAELGKVDQGGGGTISYMAAKYGMDVLDAGVPVLSMHAPWEVTSAADVRASYKAYKSFLTL